MPRTDAEALSRLNRLAMAVRVDREGSIVRDYHTVGGGRFAGQQHGLWGTKDQALTDRYYLADASFLVGLGGDDHALVDDVARALRAPVWPLFLGRRSCAPAEPVFAGTVEATPNEGVLKAIMIPRDRDDAPERIRLVFEATSAEGSPRQDDPLSFEPFARKHGLRHVRFDFVDRDSIPRATP
jgi:CRISPR system Cascade subunit CasD